MVIPDEMKNWMEIRGFHFNKLLITGIDNAPVFAVNKPEMVMEETCLFSNAIKSGDDYLRRIQSRLDDALTHHRGLPIVRFADGEYAFYQKSLECNGLYRQAESARQIRKSLPFHGEALQDLSVSGVMAPLVFPGNLTRKKEGFFSALFPRREKPSASTFLAFLDRYNVKLTGDNYTPFYVIYAWLTSALFARTVDRRKLCILNSDWDERAVKTWFEGFSSRPDLVFVDLPAEYVATRWLSQRDTVLPKIPRDVDLCLVGAGIGALGVCVDVAKILSVPAIDAGHALNMMNGRVDKSNGARLYSIWKTI
ncbi:MAG: hypothetical protein CSYNP_00018 [Syntrophus sp. SKADARSKE-3]|nr:hypothetical protein [Syntrophus sp. SKADARSKE-3]